MAKQKVLIIGAGPAGLSAARILSQNGYEVLLFEADSQVGGMSKSIALFDQIVDIGPHRFFSKDARLNDFWHAHTNGAFEKVSRLTRIFYNKKFFYYPLRGFDALFKLGFFESALCVLSYVRAKIKPFSGNSFESWVANAFGYRLYSIFFKGYTEKLWGIKCSELDSDFAAQRIKGLNLYEAVKAAFFGGGGKKHKTLVDEFSYPKKGCGVVYENMKEEIIAQGSQVLCGVNVLGILTKDKKAVGVRTDKGEFYGDIVISSAPFSDMVGSLEELDSGIKELARELRYRNTILVYVEVLQGHSACGDFLGNAADASLRRMSNTPHSLTLHNPKNSSTILECQDSSNGGSGNWDSKNQDSQGAKSTCHCETLQSSGVAIYNAESKTTQLMDCHENPADSLAMTEYAESQTDSSAQENRDSKTNSKVSLRDFSGFENESSKSENNVRIVDEKCGLQEKSQGSYLEGNDCRDFSPLPHLSQQAALFKDNWIYVHSRDTHTGRITNFANWSSGLCCGKSNAILCLEYWANDDEPLWNLQEDALIKMAKEDLLNAQLVADSALLQRASVMKIHKSYPVYARGYKENLHKIYHALDEFKDLYFIGRNGSFKYNNQDHSILMGLLCADKIMGKDCDLWHINTDYDYQEDGKTEPQQSQAQTKEK